MPMKLMTKQIAKSLPPLYANESNPNSMVPLKFFCPWNSWTWYVIEGNQDDGGWLFFGYVVGFESELGYFTLAELESVRGPGGLRIERDLYWTPITLNEVKKLGR